MKKVLLALSFIFFTTFPAYGGLVVQMKSPVTISGDNITLGEIAKISGVEENLKNQLSSIVVDRAPLAGKKRLLKTVYVGMKIKGQLPEFYDWKFEAPEIVEVYSKGQIIKGEELIENTSQFLMDENNWDPEDVVIRGIKTPEDVYLKEGPVRFEFLPISKEPIGRYVCRVEVFQNDLRLQSVPVSLEIKRFEKVFVAARDIDRSSLISNSDIKMEKRELTVQEIRNGVVTSEKGIVGKEVNRFVKRGAVVPRKSIVEPTLVERGSSVNLIAHFGSVRISGVGVARQSGFLGEIVQVKIPGTRKILTGRVIGDGLVELNRS